MNYKHGRVRTRVYRIWTNMKTRCTNKNEPSYANYGARGIGFDERWNNFDAFLADMGEPAPGMTLERMDNSVGYCQSNCIWATRLEQGRNKRNNVLLTFNGETLTVSAWAERIGISAHTLRNRVSLGWTAAETITTPVRKNGRWHKPVSFAAERGVTFPEDTPRAWRKEDAA